MVSQIWIRQNAGIWNGNGSADPATGIGGLSLAAMPGPWFPAFAGATGGGSYISATLALGGGVTQVPTQRMGQVGPANVNFSGTTVMYAKITATANGTLTGLMASPAAAGYNGLLTLGLYADAAGAPGALLTSSAATAFASAGVLTLPVTNIPIVSGTSYWFAMFTNSTSTPLWNTNITPSGSTYDFQTGQSGLPATASAGGSFDYEMWYAMVGTSGLLGSALLESAPSGSVPWGAAGTWSTTDKLNMTFGNANLSAELPATSSGWVRGTASQGSVGGLYYFELQTKSVLQSEFCGIATAGATIATGGAGFVGGAGIHSDGHISVNGTNQVSGLTLANTDIISVAVSVPGGAAGTSGMFFMG